MSAAKNLEQFAVAAPAESPSQTPAPKGKRFVAGMLDGFLYAAINAVCVSVFKKAFGHNPVMLSLLSFVVPQMYFVMPIYATGQTLGKKLLKLQVVPVDGTHEITGMRAFLREGFFKVFSMLPLALGYIAILRRPDGRAWHDKWAKTQVITLEEE